MPTISLWTALSKIKYPEYPEYPIFLGQKEVDTVIIGAGITGITTALELNDNQNIIILDAFKIGEGTTGNSTGNLYIPVGPYYSQIKKYHSTPVALNIMQARAKNLEYIEERVNQYKLDCNFQRRPFYYCTNENYQLIKQEKELFTQGGFNVEENQLKDFPIPFKHSLLISNQAKFNPLAYVTQLAYQLSQKSGVEIYENSVVRSIESKTNVLIIHTDSGQIKTKRLVIATHIPKGINLSSLLAPAYRSYAVAVKLKTMIPNGHFWGMDESDFILSTHSNLEDDKLNILIAAGYHHRTGTNSNKDHFKTLTNYLMKYFDIEEIIYQWSAQHYQSADKLPYVGAIPSNKNIYIATGFYADGLIYGTMAGRMIADQITKKQNPISKILTPYRLLKSKAICSVLKETANTFKEYSKDLPIGEGLEEIKNLKSEEGKIILINGEKYAAYKHSNGKVEIISAVCTHMKCIVRWNINEKTWDCPCHGSRFTVEGKVIEGPAYWHLKKFNSKRGGNH